MGFHVIGPQTQRMLIMSLRVVVLALQAQDGAKIAIGVGVVGPVTQSGLQADDGFIKTALLGQGDTLLVGGLGHLHQAGSTWADGCRAGWLLLQNPIQIIARDLEIGAEQQRLLIARNSLVKSALPRPHQSQVVMGIGIRGLGKQDALKTSAGIVEFALLSQDHSQAVPGAGVGGIEIDRAAQMRFGFSRPTQGLTGRSQEAPGIGMPRVSLKHLAVKLLGLGKVAGLMALPGSVKDFVTAFICRDYPLLRSDAA